MSRNYSSSLPRYDCVSGRLLPCSPAFFSIYGNLPKSRSDSFSLRKIVYTFQMKSKSRPCPNDYGTMKHLYIKTPTFHQKLNHQQMAGPPSLWPIEPGLTNRGSPDISQSSQNIAHFILSPAVRYPLVFQDTIPREIDLCRCQMKTSYVWGVYLERNN